MNKFMETQKNIENKVVNGYKKIEGGVVSGYKKIEDKFVETFLSDEEDNSGDSKEKWIKCKDIIYKENRCQDLRPDTGLSAFREK